MLGRWSPQPYRKEPPMKKSRTGSSGGEARACAALATVQLSLPLLEILADTRTAFFGLCLEAGQQVLTTMMEGDRTQLCGPPHIPDPQRRAYRHGHAPGEVTLGGRRIVVPRLRVRSRGRHRARAAELRVCRRARSPRCAHARLPGRRRIDPRVRTHARSPA